MKPFELIQPFSFSNDKKSLPFGFDPQTNHDHMPSPCHRGDLRLGRGGGKVREESGAIWAKQSGAKRTSKTCLKKVRNSSNSSLGGGYSNVFFSFIPGEMIQFWLIFFNIFLKPPARGTCLKFFFCRGPIDGWCLFCFSGGRGYKIWFD